MTTPVATAEAIKALQVAMAAEHSAVYGYGAAGGRLSTARRATAVAEFVAHETARDELDGALRGRGAKAPAALAAYAVPAITDGVAAAAFLATLEDATAAGYAGVLGSTTDQALIKLALAQLTLSATRATAWRLAAAITPAARPFPGLAGSPG